MFDRYTEKSRRVIFFSRYAASERGSAEIDADCLLLGMLREDRNVVLRWLGEGDWETVLREKLKRSPSGPISTSVDIPLTNEVKRVLAYASEEAERLGHPMIEVEHLFLGLLRETGSNPAKVLAEFGVRVGDVRVALGQDGAPMTAKNATRASNLPVPVRVVTEDGSSEFPLAWLNRLPAVGEKMTIERVAGELRYEVVDVEWKLDAFGDASPSPGSLKEVVVRVRRLGTE